MNANKFVISWLLLLIIVMYSSGCANNVKNEYFLTSYRKVLIPKEWESLISEEQAPQFTLDYDIETMLFYDLNLIFTPEMKRKLSNIDVVMSDGNCAVLQDLLHAVANFYRHIKYNLNNVHEVRITFFDDIKAKSLLACKLFVLLLYIDNEEIKNSIVKYVKDNIDSFPIEYHVLLKIYDLVEHYRFLYQSSIVYCKRQWTDEHTRRYFGLNPTMFPEDLLDMDYQKNEMITAVFDVKKFDWKKNQFILVRLNWKFDYPYKDYFNAEETEEFANLHVGMGNMCNEIYKRIEFQNVRLRYYKYINSLDYELPTIPKIPYVDYCFDKEEVEKTLKELTVSLAEWEEFAKSILEDKKSN